MLGVSCAWAGAGPLRAGTARAPKAWLRLLAGLGLADGGEDGGEEVLQFGGEGGGDGGDLTGGEVAEGVEKAGKRAAKLSSLARASCSAGPRG